MPRKRSLNREKTFEIYKERDGKITNREIATLLNEDEKVIAIWKNWDKWKVVQQTSKHCTTKKKACQTLKQKAVADEVDSVINNPELTNKQRFCVL